MYTYISYKPYAIAYIVSGSRRVAQYEAADLLCTTDKHIYLYNISYNILYMRLFQWIFHLIRTF